jgi:pimeloyl-ACP methyl ester carboxylesterase
LGQAAGPARPAEPTLDRRRSIGLALAAVAAPAALLLPGCAFKPRAPTVPMRVLNHPAACAAGRDTLLVLLPGAYSPPEEFEAAGFVDAARQARLAADIGIADAHLRYFTDKTAIQRLREDIVLPARARGVKDVWLVGISLGGFGALGYALRHPGEVSGVLAIAPYLGRRTLLRDIVAGGGPRLWRERALPEGPDDVETALWQWLSAPAPAGPPVWLAYGRDDRFADSHRLLSGLLPADRVDSVPGGHDWPPWRALWDRFLARGLLPRCAA